MFWLDRLSSAQSVFPASESPLSRSKAVELGPDGAIVRNITLFAVLIYEIVGPFLTKMALTKAGDIKEEDRKSARDEHLALKAKKEQQ